MTDTNEGQHLAVPRAEPKQGSGSKSSAYEYSYDDEDSSTGKAERSGADRQADREAVRSDLAIKNYASEDPRARANNSAHKVVVTPQARREAGSPTGQRSRSAEMQKQVQAQKKGLLNRMFGKLSKNEQKLRKKLSSEAVKLPKNFAELVLDLELLVDSGNFTIDTVNELMQLYSQAVEYYSGMNDVRYIYYTERIQNMLIRPEILRLMKDGKMGDDDRESALERARRARTNLKGTRTLGPHQLGKLDEHQQKSSKKSKKKQQIAETLTKEEQEELQRRQQELQMQKRKSRHEKLLEQDDEVRKKIQEHDKAVLEKDVEYQQDLAHIQSQKKKAEDAIKIIQTDENDQKSALQRRIEERKRRVALNRSVNAGDAQPQFGQKQKNKSFVVQGGFVPQFGGLGAKGGLTPDRVLTKSDDSSNEVAAAKQQESANSCEINQATKGSSTTQIDAMIKQLKHTGEGAEAQPFARNLLARPKTGAQTIILKSNNPFDMQANNVSINFDIQSKSSAYFLNDDELQEFEEKFQQRIQEVWATIEQKQDTLQKDYQTKLEQIYEDVTQIKFEKIAEVKLAYKEVDREQDKAKAEEMEQEIQKIKDETEVLKQQKITEAQAELETKKKAIQKEKAQMLSKIKDDLRKQKELQTQQDQQDMNQVFDYINMDDGFENERDGPCFGSSALQKKAAPDERDRSPAADREKFKAPELKKHSELKKGIAEARTDPAQPTGADAGAADDDAEFLKAGPRQRTFTFSQAESPDADDRKEGDEEEQDQDDIQSRKEEIKKQLMSLQDQEAN